MANEPKKLYRSTKNKIIGGVCGGIGEYLNIDPTIVRVGFVFISIFALFVPMILLYIVLVFIIPEAPETPKTTSKKKIKKIKKS